MAEEIQEEPQVVGPGAQLKARREALNLTVEDIAERLHLRPAVVENLENDFFDHTVSMTFTKGYVRLYAKHLDLPPEPLLVLFEQLTNPIKQPAKLRSFSQKVAKQASDARLMMVTWFIILAMIGLAGLWWWQLPEEATTVAAVVDETASSPSFSSPPVINAAATEAQQSAQRQDNTYRNDIASQEDIDNSAGAVEEVTLPDNQTTTDPQTDEFVAAEERDTQTNTAASMNVDARPVVAEVLSEASNEPQIEPAITANSQTNEAASQNTVFPEQANTDATEQAQVDVAPLTTDLIFTFSEDCWMNLTDATGEVIAYGVKSAGRVMPVSGIAPFEVILGAPQAVQLTVAGETFDMSGFPAGRTARFTVGETGNE